MPRLRFQDLPAAQVDEIKNKLHSQWQFEANVLNKTWFPDRRKAETAKAKLNAKYQRLEFDAFTQLQQQQQEQQRVQRLIKQPREYTRAEETKLRMQLRPEAERLVFPERTYLPPTYLRSKGFKENKLLYAERSPDIRGWEWGPPKKKKQDLVEQYQNWRASELYHTKNIQEQQQLDQEWDMTMASSSAYNNWWQDKTKRKPIIEIHALRSTGRIADAMRKRVAGMTPIGRSLSKGKKNILERAYGTEEEMRERYGFRPKPITQTDVQYAKPIRQRNRRTGQERISYDGGKTWEIL